jgi:hypothetical protein
MIRYRWWVAGIWAVLFLLGGYATSGLSALLTNRFTLPGTDTARADSILEDHFGQKTVGSFSVVVKGAPGSAEQLLPVVRERAAAAAKELPTGQLAGVQAVSDSVVSATIVSNLEPADAKGHTDDMRAAAGEIPERRSTSPDRPPSSTTSTRSSRTIFRSASSSSPSRLRR